MSLNIEFNNKEILHNILENILKMLEKRKIIKSYETELKNLIDIIEVNKTIYEIQTLEKTIYSINIVNYKLSSVIQNSPLDEYLSNNIDVHKIIIGKDVSKKVIKQITSDYKNTEFFFECEMIRDITNPGFVPKHYLLNKEETNEILIKFTENELSKILVTDPQSRYYGAKIGNIFRIERPSIMSGKNIFYRRVVGGTWDFYFD